MAIYYSATRNAFYADELKALYEASTAGWPSDAVEITDAVHQEMMAGQGDGQVISAGTDGLPTLSAAVSDPAVEKQSILSYINSYTQAWQTQLSLGIISDADKTTLTAWMQYYQEVQAVDTTATDITWPTAPTASTTTTDSTASTSTTTTTDSTTTTTASTST